MPAVWDQHLVLRGESRGQGGVKAFGEAGIVGVSLLIHIHDLFGSLAQMKEV